MADLSLLLCQGTNTCCRLKVLLFPGVPPPLHAMLQNGLETRLLELLQLQSPDVKFLPHSMCSDESGVPFYFFAPKVRLSRDTGAPTCISYILCRFEFGDD